VAIARWVVLGVLALPALLVLDTAIGWLLALGYKARYFIQPSDARERTVSVLPGYSNPMPAFLQGVRRIFEQYGPIIGLRYGPDMDEDKLYRLWLDGLRQANGPQAQMVYGHSFGAQLAWRLMRRYYAAGCPFGPVEEFIIDCAPSKASTLHLPVPAPVLRRVLQFYRGGPIIFQLLEVINWITGKLNPMPVSSETDREVYRRYVRGMRWFQPRARAAQLKFMLEFDVTVTQEEPIPGFTGRVLIINGADPNLDPMVDQPAATADWLGVHPNAVVMHNGRVRHANPVEWPMAYCWMTDQVYQPSSG